MSEYGTTEIGTTPKSEFPGVPINSLDRFIYKKILIKWSRLVPISDSSDFRQFPFQTLGLK